MGKVGGGEGREGALWATGRPEDFSPRKEGAIEVSRQDVPRLTDHAGFQERPTGVTLRQTVQASLPLIDFCGAPHSSAHQTAFTYRSGSCSNCQPSSSLHCNEHLGGEGENEARVHPQHLSLGWWWGRQERWHFTGLQGRHLWRFKRKRAMLRLWDGCSSHRGW